MGIGRERMNNRAKSRAAALFLVAVWAFFAALYAGAALDERQI
jgi:hypothetical protein